MIKVTDLNKKYGDVTALKDVSLEIEKGKVYGLLGPNGAGKSTLMNIISGVLTGDGEVNIDGIDIFDDPRSAKGKIGYMPEQPPVYSDLTVREQLTFIAKAKGIKGDKVNEAVERAVACTALDSHKDKVIRTLSKGYTQRVGMAGAIIGEPEYIILDEPTVALDPIEIRNIRSMIRELGKEHTVILSSHILAEVQQVCDELIIIDRGSILASGRMDEVVKGLCGERRVELVVRGGVSLKDFEGIEGVLSSHVEGMGSYNRFTFTVGERDIREALSRLVFEKGGVVCELHLHEPTLEEVFVKLISSEVEK